MDYYLHLYQAHDEDIQKILHSIPEKEEYFALPEQLAKDKIADITELNFLCLLIEAYDPLAVFFHDWEKYDAYRIDSLSQLKRTFSGPFRKFVTSSGEVEFDRHPLLSSKFKTLSALEQQLRQIMQNIAILDPYRNALQFTQHDIINDRFVLPIRSDAYSYNMGQIIARSQSGMTLFVEPPSIRDLCNQRINILAQIDEIINSICQKFCQQLSTYHAQLSTVLQFVLELDRLSAKAHYCLRHNLNRPQLNDQHEIILNNLFHPLLAHPIKNSIEIPASKRGFIISGPNTGGKTVALKSIALCHLFLHLGIFLPIDSGSICPTAKIFFLSLDQQNMVHGLSSFAAESRNYLQLLTELDHYSLVVVDEIFNSTSSEEASALAIALLEEIAQRSDSKIIVSTHHQILKTFLHNSNEYISAHVAYKDDRPTYKIFSDGPGASMAVAIFEQIPEARSTNIPSRAYQLLDSNMISYEKLLVQTAQKNSELETLLTQNKELNQQLKNQKKAAEGVLLMEKQRRLDQLQKEINDIFAQATSLLDKIRDGSIDSHKKLTVQRHRILAPLEDHSEAPATHPNYPHIPKEIKLNEFYYSTHFKCPVKVTHFNREKKIATVVYKNFSSKCHQNTLRVMPAPSSEVRINICHTIRGSIELDCRGMRLPEFQTQVETALYELLNGDIPYLSVIHGHGDGILKTWLRNYLNDHKEFQWSCAEGNDGQTNITLT